MILYGERDHGVVSDQHIADNFLASVMKEEK